MAMNSPAPIKKFFIKFPPKLCFLIEADIIESSKESQVEFDAILGQQDI